MSTVFFAHNLRRLAIVWLIGLGILVALVAATFVVPIPMPAFAASILSGQWFVDPSGTEGHVSLQFRFTRTGTKGGTHESWNGRKAAIVQLVGLDPAALTEGSRSVGFRVERDAGTFECTGSFVKGKGAGMFELTLDPQYPSMLEKRGIGKITEEDQVELALADAGVELLDELKSQDYPQPDVEEFVKMARHGVHLDYVRGLGKYGHRLGSIAQLIKARDHGVDLRYIEGLEKAGYTSLPFEMLIRARDHGVDAKFLEQYRELGYTKLPLEDMIELRDHGVDAKYLSGMHRLGYGKEPLDMLRKARDHGVTIGYVEAMAEEGYKDLPLEELIQARDHGVDAKFVRRVRANRNTRLSLDQVIALRDRGQE